MNDIDQRTLEGLIHNLIDACQMGALPDAEIAEILTIDADAWTAVAAGDFKRAESLELRALFHLSRRIGMPFAQLLSVS